jgi:hypothetical protein
LRALGALTAPAAIVHDEEQVVVELERSKASVAHRAHRATRIQVMC